MSSRKKRHVQHGAHPGFTFELNRREWLQSSVIGLAGLSTMNLWGCADTSEEVPSDWWQSGPFAPVQDEVDATPLMVEGELPSWLNGTYVRNGPNRVNSDHLLMGDGMVHSVKFESGTPVLFRNRYVQTPRLGQTDWLPPSLRDNDSNIGLVYHHERLLSLGELGLPFELDRQTLSTVGTYDFGGILQTAMTGHPKIDGRTGELLFFGYSFVRPELTFYAVDQSGAITQTTRVELRRATLIHDFSITENYAVFYDAPMFFDRRMALQGDHLPLKWCPEEGARIGLVSRSGSESQVKWFDIAIGFIFHTVNAFENESGHVVFDVIRYPEMWKGGAANFNTNSVLWRYIIDPDVGVISETQMNDRIVELPNLPPRRVGHEADHAFLLRYKDSSGYAPIPLNDGLTRVNLNDGTEVSFEAPKGIALEEPCYVSNPNSADDDGVILSLAYDLDSNQSRMWAFDPADISIGPIAKIDLPQRVPFGLHGTFMPSEA